MLLILRFKVIKYTFLLFALLLTINHSAYTASLTEIKEAVEQRIEKDKGIEHVFLKINILNNLKNRQDIELIDIIYPPKQNYIQIILFVDNQEVTKMLPFIKAVMIPTINTKLRKGDVFEESIITEIKHPRDKLPSTIILDKKHLVGKIAKKNLTEHRPLYYTEVAVPVAINKGQKVTLHFQKNNLSIETIGVALESGGIGDVIKLKNIDSGKVIIGKIQDPEVVKVGG